LRGDLIHPGFRLAPDFRHRRHGSAGGLVKLRKNFPNSPRWARRWRAAEPKRYAVDRGPSFADIATAAAGVQTRRSRS